MKLKTIRTRLKPCPNCRCVNRQIYCHLITAIPEKWYIMCGNCYWCGEEAFTRIGAEKKWNSLQCMCGTDFADEGFTFVGEHHPPEWEDDTEYIPFDEVWVEVNDENK